MLYEAGGADDLDPQAPDEFDRTGIYKCDVRDSAIRRILHCHTLGLPNQMAQFVFLLLPPRIGVLFSGKRIQNMAFYLMDQLSRLAVRRDEVVPPPRSHSV